jgi:hypothetical protein
MSSSPLQAQSHRFKTRGARESHRVHIDDVGCKARLDLSGDCVRLPQRLRREQALARALTAALRLERAMALENTRPIRKSPTLNTR